MPEHSVPGCFVPAPSVAPYPDSTAPGPHSACAAAAGSGRPVAGAVTRQRAGVDGDGHEKWEGCSPPGEHPSHMDRVPDYLAYSESMSPA
ncbi:hypothetical protein LY12_001113 [Prauserella alba]|nr:hypothetical protein [Prauserella alba]